MNNCINRQYYQESAETSFGLNHSRVGKQLCHQTGWAFNRQRCHLKYLFYLMGYEKGGYFTHQSPAKHQLMNLCFFFCSMFRAKLLYQADQTRELKVTITLLYYVNRRVKVVVSTRHSTSVMVQVNELKPPSTHWHSPVSFLL